MIGQQLRRPDGPAKLTGAARYSADRDDIERRSDLLHAALVTATVVGGRITEIDGTAARAVPGVAAVLTAADMPALDAVDGPLGTSLLPMQDDVVRYEGQPIALVAAPSRQQAEHAARLVRVRYTDLVAPTSFGDGAVVTPEGRHNMGPTDVDLGDLDAGLAAADVVVRATYSTADRHHNPIEPSSTLAWWSGDELTVQDSAQGISAVRQVLAATFDVPTDRVHVSSPFIGGGFGCKGYVHPHQLLAVAAARVLGRPVRVTLTRAQMFTGCGHQPATRQELTLGATRDGRLTALGHESVSASALADDYVEYTTAGTRWMYATPHCGCAPASSGCRGRTRRRCGRRTRALACSPWSRRWTSWPTGWASTRCSCGCATSPTPTR